MNLNKYGTPFLESELFLAATAEDEDYMERVTDAVHPQERLRIENAAWFLAAYLRDRRKTDVHRANLLPPTEES